MRYRVAAVACLATISLYSVGAMANETITYTYDTRGRLVKIVHAGTVNQDVTINQSLDKADNRTKVKVTNVPS